MMRRLSESLQISTCWGEGDWLAMQSWSQTRGRFLAVTDLIEQGVVGYWCLSPDAIGMMSSHTGTRL